MRCSKARKLFFGNCDGDLNETQKMKLQEHLGGCPSCAAFAARMEACLDMVKELPECAPSENFEWNLKRRILQERSRLIRRAGDSYLRDARWGTKFVASAAAAVVIVLIGAWFFLGGRAALTGDAGNLAVIGNGDRSYSALSLPRSETVDRYLPRSAAEMRMVSDGSRAGGPGVASDRPLAFQSAGSTREDSLLQENEYLRWYLQRLERENLILRRYLYRMQDQR